MGRALARLSGGSSHKDIDMQMLARCGCQARTKMNGKDIVKRRAEEDRPEHRRNDVRLEHRLAFRVDTTRLALT
jgi:hypothetical protein